jgi:hypothetical protein
MGLGLTVHGNARRNWHVSLSLSALGFLTPESLLHLVPSTSFPYLTSPVLYLGPCSPECEYFAIHHRNAFPPFHHIPPTRALHDLAEYHGPHYNAAALQPSTFRYSPLGHKTQEQPGSSLAGGGQTRFSALAGDVDHIKTGPHHLRDGVNVQYRRQQFATWVPESARLHFGAKMR